MQLGLKLTDETLLCGEHLAPQSSVDDFSVGCIQGVDGRAELSYQGDYWLERAWRDLHSDVHGWQGYLSNFAWRLNR